MVAQFWYWAKFHKIIKFKLSNTSMWHQTVAKHMLIFTYMLKDYRKVCTKFTHKLNGKLNNKILEWSAFIQIKKLVWKKIHRKDPMKWNFFIKFLLIMHHRTWNQSNTLVKILLSTSHMTYWLTHVDMDT